VAKRVSVMALYVDYCRGSHPRESMSLSSPAGHTASVAGSPAQPRPEPREPCVRLHIPVVGTSCEISWASELKRAGAGAGAGAGGQTGVVASSAEPATNGGGPSDAAAPGHPPAAAEPVKSRRELDFVKPQNRFHQMVQEMERKYATARPLMRSKRPAGQEGSKGGGKPKVARSAAEAGSSAAAAGTAGTTGTAGTATATATAGATAADGPGGATAADIGGGSVAVRSDAKATAPSGAGGDSM
jgi:hypothetical protein